MSTEENFIAEGDRVVALTGGVVKHRASGKKMKIDLVDVLQFRDGRIAAFTSSIPPMSSRATARPR